MAETAVAASSATYRKATNRLADELDIEPTHTDRPSRDFERAADRVGDKLRKRARKYYRLGIRRGFIDACNRMLEGQLELKGDALYLYGDKVIIDVRVRLAPGEEKRRQTFTFSPDKLEFD